MTGGDEAQVGQTPLGRRIAARIARHGPMSLAEYMTRVLTDPQHGYYMTGDPFGTRGDFVTAPEISQMFGELLGLWCADTWRRSGAPDPVLLVELGPGRGTLMADALRATRRLADFGRALRLHMVEVSPALRAQQARALEGLIDPARVTWCDHLAEVPEGPLLLLANEFFDALPLRQFERTPDGWCERLVVLKVEGPGQEETLAFGLSPPDPLLQALVPAALRERPVGCVAEVSAAGPALAADIAERVCAAGGGALIVDYGYARPDGRPTLQAVRRHLPHDVLEAPGTADLTAHVDFAGLAAAATAAGARVAGPLPQGRFLERLGIGQRAEALSATASPEQAREIAAALRRLTDPAEMGEAFKVLAIAHPGRGPMAGFA